MNAFMSHLAQVATWVDGQLGDASQSDVVFEQVSTDTRTLSVGDLFIALKGERFDAHDFLKQLQKGQVAAVIAEHVPAGFDLPYVLVSDTRIALQDLAKHWREQFDMPLALITGSNGKTTVKEMLAAITHAAYPNGSLATKGNLNNDIGLPLTLLQLTEQHKAAVIELGMNHAGETAQLAPITAPTVVVINNAQREHQEFMQTVTAVAQEHADALLALPVRGAAVFPADDEHAFIWRELAQSRELKVFDFSLDEASTASFTARFEMGIHASTVQLITPMGQCTTQINIPGVHNVHNALAACAAACAMNIGLDKIAQGLADFVPAKGRLQTHPLGGGVTLIDDTYNANPDSVRAAIDVLAASVGRKILVLGDMGEVGEQGQDFHEEIGAYARSSGIHVFLAAGDLMKFAVTAYGQGACHFDDVLAISPILADELTRGAATILVKGSRFMGMERVVQPLLDETKQKTAV
jgi:UDP-N-acetylmuramoyl-tripeptide--D-alanyl-D-alanine ligase